METFLKQGPQEQAGEGTTFVYPWPYRRMNSAIPDPLAGDFYSQVTLDRVLDHLRAWSG